MRFVLIFWLACLPAFGQKAELAVTGARIYTVDPARPHASAIAVRDGRILAISDDVSGLIGPATQVIDAHGATVIPGLIDSHGHVEALGASLSSLDLRGVSSEAAAAEKVRIAASRAPPGEWITGQAWDQNLWPGATFPSWKSISAAAPANPVALSRVDGHALWVNRAAMKRAQLGRATPEPPGGRILRDPQGEPTGVLLDRARLLIEARIPPPSPEQVRGRILAALNECARLGLTTVDDAGVNPAVLEAYRVLAREGRLPIRAYVMIGGAGPALDRQFQIGPEIGDRLTIRAVKLIADGALGSRGASMLQAYSDDPSNRGLVILDRAAIRDVAARAAAHGFQVATHAIGDAANRAALNAYADVLKGRNDRRFRIEHAQIVAPEDFAKFRDYSIIASMQPTHATSDMPWASDRIGPVRIRGAYAWQTFLRLGVHVPSGSDFPVESPDPLRGFYAAVTRMNRQGQPPGGWMPDQRMTREQALRSWTIEGAYAAFEERIKGSLAPGKVADFVLLSDDIMTVPDAALLEAHVTMTVSGGKIVYRQ